MVDTGARRLLGFSVMRALLMVLLGGCLGAGSAGGSAGSRPAVIPMLSELPPDSTRRDAVLESANVTAGPEQRKGMTRKERTAETAAATAAAILGEMFSHTKSVTIGGATQFEENKLIAPDAMPPIRPVSTDADGAAKPGTAKSGTAKPDGAKPDAPPADDNPSNADLIPWIKLK